MEESLSWQAKLARHNINILSIDDERWFYEFMYHPHSGSTKWSKTFYTLPRTDVSEAEVASDLVREVARLRRELER